MIERRLISFTAGGRRFAVPIDNVREVVSVVSVVPVPGGKRPLEGICQYRDNMVLPVFSLPDMLGLTRDEAGSLVIVAGAEDDPVGFRVQSMGGVLTSSDADEVTPYEGDLDLADGAVTGVLQKTGGELILLDLERLFDS